MGSSLLQRIADYVEAPEIMGVLPSVAVEDIALGTYLDLLPAVICACLNDHLQFGGNGKAGSLRMNAARPEASESELGIDIAASSTHVI